MDNEPFLEVSRDQKPLFSKAFEILFKFLEVGLDIFGGAVHLLWGNAFFSEDPIKELVQENVRRFG